MSDDINAKMDPALKARWVEALRSGEYKQGQNKLRCGDHYCCLGVLCEISGLKSVNRSDDYGYRFTFNNLDYNLVYLPHGFQPINVNQETTVARMNDADKSFEEIATFIEETF